MDRISGLPLGVLHHILSYLPETELAYTFVLSKHWNSVRSSYPVLQFTQPLSLACLPVHHPDRLGRLLRHIDNSLQTLVRSNLSIERFHLTWFLVHPDSLPLLDTWLPSALHNGVLHILFNVNVASLEPGTGPPILPYTLSQTSFALNSSRFFPLETLTLGGVHLSERIVADIIKNCPAIRRLSLDWICGLKTLTISNLDQLVSLTVSVAKKSREFDSLSVDAVSLEHFSFYTESTHLTCDVDLIRCHNLRKLEITRSSVSSDRFNQQISRCPLLELLDLSLCDRLTRIRLPLQRLKHLRVSGCHHIRSIKIDSPALSTFDFVECDLDHHLPTILSSQVFCKMLQHTERHSERHYLYRHYRCRRLRCKCWHRRLKDVKIDSIGSDGEIKHKLVLDPIPSIPWGTDVRFRFDWDLSGIERFGSGLDRFSLSTLSNQKDYADWPHY